MVGFEGPDYSKEDVNEFKDLYLVVHYPNRARDSIEVYCLGDLGRIPETSKWGNIEHLRWLYDYYKMAVDRHKCGKNMGCYNNCNWFVARTTEGVRGALEQYWNALKGETNNANACIVCKFFSDKEYYADNTVNCAAVSWGSCTKCQRNITSTNPHTEVPSWCPLKRKEDGTSAEETLQKIKEIMADDLDDIHPLDRVTYRLAKIQEILQEETTC